MPLSASVRIPTMRRAQLHRGYPVRLQWHPATTHRAQIRATANPIFSTALQAARRDQLAPSDVRLTQPMKSTSVVATIQSREAPSNGSGSQMTILTRQVSLVRIGTTE